MQISQERRKKAIKDMNPKLVDMAESDTIFEDAAPNLFGDKFAKEAKDREDQLRCLDRASGRGRTTNIFDMAALWPPAKGAATLPPAGEASEEGDASNHTPNTKNPKEKKTITRKGLEEPNEEAEITRGSRSDSRTN